jgi:hypothetical protein
MTPTYLPLNVCFAYPERPQLIALLVLTDRISKDKNQHETQ